MARPEKLEEGFRYCKRCDTTKSLSEFHRDKNESGGHKYTCKSCGRAYSLHYSRQHIGRQKENNKRVRDRVRAKVLSLLGDKCKHCGITDKRVLQIDHIDGGGAKELRAIGNTYKYLKLILQMPIFDALQKYQLLCANCNWIKKFENNEGVNGTPRTA
jgi:hypothetical protein